MEAMTYNGYRAAIEYSEADQCLIGRVADIRDVVGFHGTTESELREAFHEALDEYLATCQKLGKAPDRPNWNSWFDEVGASPDFMAVRDQTDQ